MTLPFIGHFDHYRALSQLDQTASGRGILLEGPPGIGKRTMALAWIASVLCTRPRPPDHARAYPIPCGECAACVQVGKRSSPELRVLEAGEKTIISIQAVREAKSWASLTPLSGRLKFLLIDDAHLLHRSAVNALLKLLEEPSKQLFIVLVTAKPARLPATIASRCLRFRLTPPPWTPELAEWVAARVPDLPLALIERWFIIMNGSLGFLVGKPLLDWEALRRLFFSELILREHRSPPDAWMELLSAFKRDSDLIFALMSTWVRDLSVLLLNEQTGVSHGQDLVHADLWAESPQAITHWTSERLKNSTTLFLEARRGYRDVLHYEMFWEDFFYRWVG